MRPELPVCRAYFGRCCRAFRTRYPHSLPDARAAFRSNQILIFLSAERPSEVGGHFLHSRRSLGVAKQCRLQFGMLPTLLPAEGKELSKRRQSPGDVRWKEPAG